MSLVPFPAPSSGGDDDNISNNHSETTPPIPSIDSLTISSSSSVPRGPVKLTARSCLYEICAKYHWKRPVFASFSEEGPSNLRSFTFKVNVEMQEDSIIALECIGKPQLNKKSAADSAAEGVLWYLEHLGYPKKPVRSKKLRLKKMKMKNKERTLR